MNRSAWLAVGAIGGALVSVAGLPPHVVLLAGTVALLVAAVAWTRRGISHGAIAIAVGCDTHHASLAEELETLLEAGYTSAEALRAATLGGATLCGQADRVGTLEPGKLADFIAVQGDPLADPPRALRNLRAVFKGGARQPV